MLFQKPSSCLSLSPSLSGSAVSEAKFLSLSLPLSCSLYDRSCLQLTLCHEPLGPQPSANLRSATTLCIFASECFFLLAPPARLMCFIQSFFRLRKKADKTVLNDGTRAHQGTRTSTQKSPESVVVCWFRHSHTLSLDICKHWSCCICTSGTKSGVLTPSGQEVLHEGLLARVPPCSKLHHLKRLSTKARRVSLSSRRALTQLPDKVLGR